MTGILFYILFIMWGSLGFMYTLSGDMNSAMVRIGFACVFFGIAKILGHLEEQE